MYFLVSNIIYNVEKYLYLRAYVNILLIKYSRVIFVEHFVEYLVRYADAKGLYEKFS